LLTQLKSNRVL